MESERVPRGPTRLRWELGLALLAAAVARFWVASRTLMPSRDGAQYLWLAQGVGEARPDAWADLWQSVFHPLYPLLVGLTARTFPELDLVTVGQLVAGAASTIAVVPLMLVAERVLGRSAACWTGVLYAIGPWFCRYPAECMSEGVFFAAVALAAWAALAWPTRSGALTCGLASGLAFATRPEGATLGMLLIPVLWQRVGPGRAAIHAAVFGGSVLGLMIGWRAHDPGAAWTLSPKAGFVYRDGVGHPTDGGLTHYLTELSRIPGALLEGVGWFVVPLAASGLWIARSRRHPTRDLRRLLWPLWIQAGIAAPLLRSHPRFLCGYGLLLLPFAGYACAALHRRATLPRGVPQLDRATSRSRRTWLSLVLLTVIGSDLLRLWPQRNAHRVVLRDLGQALRIEFESAPSIRLVTPLQRLALFANRRPPPPRTMLRQELFARCQEPGPTIYVSRAGSEALTEPELRSLGFSPRRWPQELAGAAQTASIIAWERR